MLLAAGREVVSKTSAYNITKLTYRVECVCAMNESLLLHFIKLNWTFIIVRKGIQNDIVVSSNEMS